MANLPREIVDEIVLRLPVKSLLRFKSLNQSWYTRIRSLNFVRSYKQQQRANTMNPKKYILYPIKPDFPMYSVSASTYTEGEATMDVVSHNIGHDYEIVGSCDGLLLVSSKDLCQLGIWNPSTREFKRLPKSDNINSNISYCDRFGFGCVSEKESYNNYKVIHIEWSLVNYGTGDPQGLARVFLYTSCRNSWRRMADIPSLKYCSLSVLVNSKLHFLAGYVNESKEILAFDITDEEFGVIPQPDYDGVLCYSIAELNGKLCVISYKQTIMYLWTMKEYGVKESWINMFSIDLVKLRFHNLLCGEVWPLHILEDGKILLHGTYFCVNTSGWTTRLIVFDDSATCCKLDCVTSKSRYQSIIYEETPLSPNAIA